MSSTQLIQLHEENLIPLYLIEDKLKQNFRSTNSFIRVTKDSFSDVFSQIRNMQVQQKSLKDTFEAKMIEMEKKITQQISLQLEGRIAIAIGKSIDSFTQKMDKKEKEMGDFQDEFAKKNKKMKEDLKFEISQENQKLFSKETKKMQESLKKLQKKMENGHFKDVAAVAPSNSNPEPSGTDAEGQNWQEQHEFMKQIEKRTEKLEQFSISVDKRIYNGMTSLKDSWKQLGTQLLENKKNLTKKMDEIRMQFIKLKNLKQFQFAPNKVEEEFQRKLAEKFTDIYQLLSHTLTKNEYESAFERISGRIGRHDDDFIEIRKQLASNNEYFTFYMNNASQDDLRGMIDTLDENMKNQRHLNAVKVRELKQENQRTNQQLGKASQRISVLVKDLQQKLATIARVNEVVSLVEARIQNLEDFNRFGPDKLETIHNVLDGDFTANERELIQTKQFKQKNNGIRDLKIELAKMKDEMFIISSQNLVKEEELANIKKMYAQIETRMQKMRGQTDQASITRKPWVCLSCDRQEKDKDQQKKQLLKQKKQGFKGFGTQRSSEKTLKAPAPAQGFQQRFEVYEKFKQKYLSDASEINQKIGKPASTPDRQASFHS